MKKSTILLLFILLCSCYSFAQIAEEERSMTQGMNNALIMDIPNADDREVEKLWKKFMKSNGSKTKKIKKSEEWFSDNADMPSVGGASDVDLYATFEQSGNTVRMTAWFDIDGTYLSSSTAPDKYESGETFLKEFETHVYKEGIKEEIKSEENSLKKLESNLKKLKKANGRLHKEIEDAKKRIAKAEANIETNLIEQEEANTKIDLQKEVVGETKKKLDHREEN